MNSILIKFIKLAIVLVLAPIQVLFGQALDHKQGELIVSFNGTADMQGIANKMDLSDHRCLSERLQVWEIAFDHDKVDMKVLMSDLQSLSSIATVQKNHFLSRRSIPDDPELSQQWWIINDGQAGLVDADIDLDEAWEMTTGGITPLGDTIVVAVLDNGIDDKHPDLQGNLWINHREIPLNGIDEDGNGYVDDYRGWNANLENDNIDAEQMGGGKFDDHGTLITGILGARSNNGIGVAGMNWDIKIMTVNINTELLESDMIAAYAYVMDQRIRYNESDGAEGAYVVATNLSYGEVGLTPEDTPIWCAIYDSLGAHGILNVTATANQPLDIDVAKDIPGSCTSDHMIAVTATNQSDERTFAAFGVNDIDLAAPGRNIWSTSIPDYNMDVGASFAAPMVVGTVALLYSSPCSDLAALSKLDPAAASLMARALVEDNVDKIESLTNELKTGGRLNAANSLRALIASCSACIAPAQITAQGAIDTSVITFIVADSIETVNLLWKENSDSSYQQIDSISSPFILSALGACALYDIQLISNCSNGNVDTSGIIQFSTEGCCLLPDSIVATPSTSSVNIDFIPISESTEYEVWIQEPGDTLWRTITDTIASIEIDSLESCTEYLFQVRSMCPDDSSSFSDAILFVTQGCGTCLDSIYCLPEIALDNPDYIDSFALHTIENRSGADGGYGDYTGDASTVLKQGSAYRMSIHPGSSDLLTERRYYAWIDFDQSGSFENETELVSLSDSATMDPYQTIIQIPDDVALGSTRLRILSYMESSPDTIDACSVAVEFGEVEDYCLTIIFDSLLCDQTPLVDTILVTETSAEVIWDRVDSSIAYTFRWKEQGTDEWMDMADTTNTFTIPELEECTTYEFQVNTVCSFDTSGYTESLVFTTTCMMVPTNDIVEVFELNVYPNPFLSELSVEIRREIRSRLQIELFNMQGQSVSQPRTFNQVEGIMQLTHLNDLPPGIYFLSIRGEGTRKVHKLIKS